MQVADNLMRLDFASPGSANLAGAFSGTALTTLEAQSQSLGLRGTREEERGVVRDLVFWDPVADEAVLQVVAETRLVTRDEPNPAWSSTARQWWARLQNVGGSWRVVEQEDLPPDRWWPVSPASGSLTGSV